MNSDSVDDLDNTMLALWGKLRMFPLRRRVRKPTRVFHYTTADSAFSILKHGEMWLTNASFLQDPAELSYPVHLAREVVTALAFKTSDSGLSVLLSEVAETIDSHVIYKPWYVASFSLNGNLLSQWRAYCRQDGYSLGFDGDKLVCLLTAAEADFGDVIYDQTKQRTCIGELVEAFIDFRSQMRSDHQTFERRASNTLAEAIGREALFFKQPAFEEEQEWRVVVRAPSSQKIKFRNRGGIVSPYVPIDFRQSEERLPLCKLYVGPAGDWKLLSQSAQLLLDSKNYNTTSVLEWCGYELRS